MHKHAVVVLCVVTMALAQDLDSILLDIYGPDMNTNMIDKNSGETETVEGAFTDDAQPIPIKQQGGESCTIGETVGRCVPYDQCTESIQDKHVDTATSRGTCANILEVCCTQ